MERCKKYLRGDQWRGCQVEIGYGYLLYTLMEKTRDSPSQDAKVPVTSNLSLIVCDGDFHTGPRYLERLKVGEI